ncbi:MAG: SusC/RagA family TonB-linked outer membrane protein [Phycisphaerales bacterium]|nr:SusC/RagA family TonB-linked outer membrane protein [Phycisphaerales bacterium]
MVCVSYLSVAQTYIIRGKIVDDSTGKVLPFTNIEINKEVVQSNDSGYFNLVIPYSKIEKLSLKDTVLPTIIDRIGYKKKVVYLPIIDTRDSTLVASGQIPMIMLTKAVKNINEVVVVGYGSVDKDRLTGSVSTIKNNVVGGTPLSIDQLMQNKAAGVQISTANGTPGSAISITIRGLSSLNNNGNGNAPLIVIDGVPIYGIDQLSNTTTFASPQSGIGGNGPTANSSVMPNNSFEQNPLASLNPDDIASIEILKDAYATAIYGSRGAAGVILITTKRGSVQKTTINAQVSTTIQTPIGLPKGLMNGDQYASFYTAFYDSLKNRNISPYWPPANSNFPKGINTNWLKNVIRPAVGIDASIDISGGNEKLRYYVSGAYNKTQSYIVNNDFQRVATRVNLDGKVNNHFSLGISVQVSYTNNNAINAGTIYFQAVQKAPNLPIYDASGQYLWRYGNNPSGNSSDVNPLGIAYTGKNYINNFRTTGNFYLEYKIVPWLNFRTEFGVDLLTTIAYSRLIDKPSNPGGLAQQTTNLNFRYVSNNVLTADKKWGHQHALNVIVGQSFEQSTQNSSSFAGVGFLNDNILSIQSANTRSLLSAINQRWALLSYFTRANYTFLERYIVGITYRVDGSSLFSANNRFVGFPSISAGWIPSNESFWARLPFINSLKIRGSIGFSGTDGGIGFYGQQGQFAPTPNNDSYGNIGVIGAVQPNNPNIKWEKTTTIDGGIDVSFFQNDRITMTLDVYSKDTKGAILQSPLPSFLGFASVLQNVAEIRNAGFECLIKTKNITTSKFSWTSSINFATNKNTIVQLSSAYSTFLSQFSNAQGGANAYQYWVVGKSASAFNLFNWGGIDKKTGNPIWIGADGSQYTLPISVVFENDAQLLEAQRQYFGDALPKLFGGFENDFKFHNFECSIFFSFSIGNKLFNGTKSSLYGYTSTSANNLSTDLLDYWQSPNSNTNIPALINNSNLVSTFGGYSITDYTVSQYISRFLEDASFLRLKNLTIAYNLPNKVMARLHLKQVSCRFFIEGTNLFTITRYTGVDPEVSANGSNALVAGYDGLSLPNPRTFRFGIKIGV